MVDEEEGKDTDVWLVAAISAQKSGEVLVGFMKHTKITLITNRHTKS